MWKLEIKGRTGLFTDKQLDNIVMSLAIATKNKSFFSDQEDKLRFLNSLGVKHEYWNDTWYVKLYKIVKDIKDYLCDLLKL